MTDQKQTNTQEMLGSLRETNINLGQTYRVIKDAKQELLHAADGIDGQLQRMSYHLNNISTCCTIIAGYVAVKCAWWLWLTFEAVASLPIE